MKTNLLYVIALMVAIGGQTIPTTKPIGTNPGTERRYLTEESAQGEIGGAQGRPHIPN